jgi:hypothetical protein
MLAALTDLLPCADHLHQINAMEYSPQKKDFSITGESCHDRKKKHLTALDYLTPGSFNCVMI